MTRREGSTLAPSIAAPPAPPPADGRAPRTRAATYDFRRADLFNRDAVRALHAAHELFTRRVASAWGSALRVLVQLDPIGVDQVPYDAYIRSMPNPNVLAILKAEPLPGSVVCEMNPQLALTLVDRLLGGCVALGGEPVESRRPTDLESALLGDLAGQLAVALTETLSVVPDCRARIEGMEYSPQLVQVVAPSDTVLVLSYRLGISQGIDAEGLLTLCYPAATVMPLVDRLQQQRHGSAGSAATPARSETIARQLLDIALPLTVAFGRSQVAAADVAALAEGDVLRLDQRVGAPVLALLGERPVLEGHLGRRGRRLAFQVARWLTSRPDNPSPDIDGRQP